MTAGDFRLLGTWTAGVAAVAFAAAYLLLPRPGPSAAPVEPGIVAESCVAECAPV